MMNKKSTSIFGGVVAFIPTAVLFAGVVWVAGAYGDILRQLIGGSTVMGMNAYVVLIALSVIFAPLTTTPLIPFASTVFGFFPTAILSAVGWTLVALISFGIARQVGVTVIERIVPVARLHALEKFIPERHLFWSLILLRIAVPVDILSYALGLFSRISWSLFF